MKKILLLSLCLLLLLTPLADAAIGQRKLIVNHGITTLTIRKGEKKWLYVRDGGTKLLLLKGVRFYSDNTLIVTVGQRSGVVCGNSIGTATIAVIHTNGRSALIKVTVVGGKAPPLLSGLFLLLFLLGLFLFLLNQKRR